MRRLARALWRAIVAVWLWRAGSRRRRSESRAQRDPSERRAGVAARIEGVVVALLALATAGTAAFAALFILDPDTQLLGVADRSPQELLGDLTKGDLPRNVLLAAAITAGLLVALSAGPYYAAKGYTWAQEGRR